MCGMSSMRRNDQITPDNLSNLLQNRLFKNIKSVGVNGGEPFLLPDLEQYIAVLIRDLPRLENIFIITNGFFTDKILLSLEKIKNLSSKNKVKLTVSVSIDGINDTHDFIRGRRGAFNKAEKTCLAIVENKDRYCDHFGVICTITKHNIYNINEVDIWSKKHKIGISYNVATVHKRLFNESKFEDFSVFSDEHARLLAAEFFHSKFYDAKSPTYWALYKYVSDRKRRTGCSFKYNGVTLLPDGSISFCATRSNVLGSGLQEDAYELFRNNIGYRDKIIKNECASCSHYVDALTLNAALEYNKEFLKIIGKPFLYRC
jgi:MoaA/NifB/PqqE/SkfB family radical SAM enzyme